MIAARRLLPSRHALALGTHRDDLGVERVRLHTLWKPVERARTAMR